ncbi:MAG: T9SS type A sorting domain-containing protein [Chitinophagales bacterium]|nr:T9SS type A sorting domain-containing protein [Chitinophagales bacterium]MDW8427312.1 T9SS type A sorting domain-containing protein [Chitinophagales bacterium]
MSVRCGTATYTFLWNDGATTEDRSGLAAGTYTVTVTDANGCSAQATFNVTEPPCTISLSVTGTDALCHGDANGTIDLTVSGAQGSVSFLWNDGATTEDRTGLTAGTYTVTVTDQGGCQATISFTVNQPAVLGMTGVVNNVSITGGSDGSIDVTVSGGTAPYSFLWNDGATTEDRTGLSAGTYTVTVTDANGCSAQATFNVAEPPCVCDPPVVLGVDSICGNQALVCWTSVECAVSYILRWNVNGGPWIYETISTSSEDTTCTNFTNVPGNVNVIEVAAVCANGDTSVFSTPFVHVGYPINCSPPTNLTSSSITSNSAVLSWTANPAAIKYQVWYKNTVTGVKTTVKTSATSITLTGLSSNTKYSWKVKSQCEFCGYKAWGPYSGKKNFTTLPLRTGESVESNEAVLRVYPNPANSYLMVELFTGSALSSDFTMEIKDMLGRTVYSETGSTEDGSIYRVINRINEFPDGTYMLLISTNGTQYRQQVVIGNEQ